MNGYTQALVDTGAQLRRVRKRPPVGAEPVLPSPWRTVPVPAEGRSLAKH